MNQPTFICRHSADLATRLTCRETGDRYTIAHKGSLFYIYINGCFQAKRPTYEHALLQVEQDARLSLPLRVR